MVKLFELKIKNPKQIYTEIASELLPYREEETRSIEFIVEGSKKEPIIGIRYPGKKVKKRELKRPRPDSALWENLYDFQVVPYKNNVEIGGEEFTFDKLLKDFEENKRDNEEFWKLIEGVYKKNELTKEPPKLSGIDSKIFLLALKWMWIQEDFNYKLTSEDVGSPIKYILVTKSGSRTGKGAGRARFFAALILLKHYFTLEEVKNIIPMYG